MVTRLRGQRRPWRGEDGRTRFTRGTIWSNHSVDEEELFFIALGETKWGTHKEDDTPGVANLGTTVWRATGPTTISLITQFGLTEWGHVKPPAPLTAQYLGFTNWGSRGQQFLAVTEWGHQPLPDPEPVPFLGPETYFPELTRLGRLPDVIPLKAKRKMDYVTFGTVWNIRAKPVELGHTRWNAPSTLTKVQKGFYDGNR